MVHGRKAETNWLITASLVILAVVALAAALIYTRAVMVPFVTALFIVALVAPIQDFQVKWLRFPRAISIIITLLIVLAIIALVTLSIAQVSRTVAYTAGDYSKSFEKMANKLLDLAVYVYQQEEPEAQPPATPNEPKPTPPPAAPNEPKPVEKKPKAFELFPLVKDTAGPATLDVRPRSDLTPEETKEPNEPNEAKVALPPVSPDEPLVNQWQSIAKQVVLDLKNYIFNILTSAVGTLFGLISGVFFVTIFVFFMLLGRNPYAEHSQMYREVVTKIQKYIGLHTVVSIVTGVLVWATLAIIGLKLAGVFGILAFFLNFIPSIGSTIVTLLPIPIAVVQFSSSPWLIVLVVAIPGAIQNLLGNIIEPKLQGEGLDLHPVTILLALSFWGLLWGIMGMFLAAPITAGIRIVLMQFDTFRPIADLLAGDFSKPQAAAAAAAVEVIPAATPSEGTEPAGSPPE